MKNHNNIFKKKTILITEDNIFCFQILEILLKNTGAEIIRAKNGKDAIKICKEKPDINIVLMDINMPIMDGLNATKKIKEFMPELPIIMQTLFTKNECGIDAEKAGCSDYITKPINKDELINKTAKYII